VRCANRSRIAPPRRSSRGATRARARSASAAANLDAAAQVRFAALKAWRAEVAREHNLPAYVIFHDATLAAIAARARLAGRPARHQRHRREEAGAYGSEVLRVCLGLTLINPWAQAPH
jgi:ATP-dependent DNA helicase RecQ